MVPIAIAAAAGLVLVGDGAAAKGVAVVYGLACVGLYGVSAAAHYKVWDAKTLHLLFQFDHSMIMVFIAASTVPVGFAVGGGSGWALVVGMVVGTGVGLVMIWAPFHPPRGFMNTLFFAVGWWPVFFIRSIGDGLGAGGVALLLGGGAVFTVGAFIVGFQRPNPNPLVFGYHEIWHIFVIVGNAIHFAMVAAIVAGAAPL